MFGISVFDWICIGIAIVVTIVLASKENPYEPASNEHQALRLCRISLGLIVWSFAAGIIGFALALVAFILAIIGIVKGRTAYGITMVVCSVVVPFAGMFYTFSSLIAK